MPLCVPLPVIFLDISHDLPVLRQPKVSDVTVNHALGPLDRVADVPGRPLPAMANNWTRGAAHRHTTAPINALGLHPVARELLLISRPAEGRRLSWHEHTVQGGPKKLDHF